MQVFFRQFAFWNIAECYISKYDTNNPYSVKVLLGWTMTGPPNQKCNVTESISQLTNFIDTTEQDDATLTDVVEKYWEVKESGIHENNKTYFSEKSKKKQT